MNRVSLSITLIVAFTAGCTTPRMAHVTPDMAIAVKSSEVFIARHGFTSAGHPKDQPVEYVEMFDEFYASKDEMLTARNDSLDSHAFGISPANPGWYVLFKDKHGASPDRATAVLIVPGKEPHLMHAQYYLKPGHWRRLPMSGRRY